MSRRLGAAAATVLVLASCSGGATPSPAPSPTPSSTASPTASPSPAPTRSPEPTTATLGVSDAAVAYVESVAGYELVELPPSLEDQIASEMAGALGSGDDPASQAILGYAARSVALNGESVGFVLVLELEPGWTALPGSGEGFAQGVAGAGTVTATTVAGQSAFLIATEAMPAALAYLQGNFGVTIFGTDESSLIDLAEGLITANG